LTLIRVMIAAGGRISALAATCTRTLWEARMPAPIDITGQRFERLVALECLGSNNHGKRMWRCLCDCGKEIITSLGSLKSGHIVSCGCYGKERRKRANTTHDMCKTPEFRAWQTAKGRCLNPSDKSFKRYAPLGFHDDWIDDFIAFFNHIGLRPGPGYSIDRIDNERGYFPGNIKWSTRKEQNNNRRPPRRK